MICIWEKPVNSTLLSKMWPTCKLEAAKSNTESPPSIDPFAQTVKSTQSAFLIRIQPESLFIIVIKVTLPQSQITLHIILFKGYPHFFALSFSILAARSWDKVNFCLFRLSKLWFPLTVSSFVLMLIPVSFLFPSGLFCSWLIFHIWSSTTSPSQLICRADDCVDSLKAVNKHNFLTQHHCTPLLSLNTYWSNPPGAGILELNSSLLGQPHACTNTLNHNRGFHL